MQKTQKSEKTITFYVKNCKKEQFCFVFVVFLAFLTSKSEKATAGQKKTTIILQILLGNRIWSRARARPPARTHERNETISRLGPLRSHPPNLR